LLVVATALFAAGVIAERHARATERPAASAEGHHHESAEAPSAHASEGRVLGVNLESTPLIVLAIAAGLGLAALVASPLGSRPAVLLAIALAALAWAALDVREVVHQAGDSRTGLAVLAAVVAVLHLAVAAGAAARGAQPDAGVA
jgi:hypothetical protein